MFDISNAGLVICSIYVSKPDIVILLTVDEENRAKRMRERGELVTDEERNLAADIESREAVLRIYHTFDPIELDTSKLSPDAVLDAVLAELYRFGLR